MAGPRVPAQLLPHREEDLDPAHRVEFIDWAERLYYEAGLKATGANKKRLAERLELSRDYMHRRLKTLRLPNSGAEALA
ncbi:MAG TPA: hypothetical protein VJB59_01420 [Bdellovibrionota bacterium]|nr:hypothetical protein [Bdellovibrionota bacterium]